MQDSMWVVTYCDDGDPVVTCFNNYEAAQKCFEYYRDRHEFCCLDECDLYSSFNVTE